MRDFVASIEGEYRRYKALGEAAMQQLSDDELCAREDESVNSIATIVWHVSGNLSSRFSDFLRSDGEKPWRIRDEEFEVRTVTRAELLAKWQQGWSVLLGALAELDDADLTKTITIRATPMRVHEALHRSLSHTSYHVGQIVHIGKTLRKSEWQSLSIPLGKSAEYNAAPTSEKATAHAKRLEERG